MAFFVRKHSIERLNSNSGRFMAVTASIFNSE